MEVGGQLSERRYGEDEVREVLERATSTEGHGGGARSSGEGLTLAELEEIGIEVGLDPARIARAASALDSRGAAEGRRTHFGMPISTGTLVDLPRAPTDHEWALLVAELRSTFGAKGKLTEQGSMREWSNGNLHAALEPSESGYRLRLGTLKGTAAPWNSMGLAAVVAALVLVLVLAITGRLADEVGLPLLLAALGGSALGFNALTLPRWAAERERQMEYIAQHARALVGPPEPEHLGTGADTPHGA